MPLRVFPVIGPVNYVDDFGYEKPDGRKHQGIDIHAPLGSVLVAVDDGVVTPGEDPRGGHVVNLLADDGVRYYMAHERDAVAVSGRVRAGDALGLVGMSGNAIGTSPHVHFEMHPGGGAAVNPYAALKAAQAQPPPLKQPSVVAALVTGAAMIVGAIAAAVAIRRK